MAIIGNPIVSTDFPVDYKSGDGSTTAFTLSIAPASVNAVDVLVSGVSQSPQTYTISGTTLTFSAAPPSGTNNIVIRHRGIAGSPNVPALGSVQLSSFSASGTPSSSTYLRGDNTWSTITSNPGTVTSVSGTGTVSGLTLSGTVTSSGSLTLGGTLAVARSNLPTGCIVQVVQATTGTSVINNTGTQGTTNWVSTPLTASITPTSSSNKILVMVMANVGGSNAYNQQLKIVRNGSTDINVGTSGTNNGGAGIATSTRQPDPDGINGVPMNYLDSPATTSSTSYTVYLGNTGGTQYQARFNLSVNNSTYTGNPLSTMILMEVAA